MPYRLSLKKLPLWAYSSFRYFEKNEHHVTRTYKWDVLVMVFEGVLRFRENGVPVEVHAGEYYIQRSGMLQEGLIESDSPKYYFIQWTDCEYTEDEEESLPIRGKVDFTDFFSLFKELETLRITKASLIEKSAVFYKILSLLRKKSMKSSSNEVVSKVISEVTKDIRKPFSLDVISAYCGYSKNHIISIFKKETGKTPHAYILDMKIDMAKQLLQNSESSLYSISIECGFGNYINFYRTFTKRIGCAPDTWRRSHK
ncbi:MAG: helix-turn-helix transcriptional regulator [Ruminococcaceae bacterium]|nr:helix-turn-helix transcriptional regulator [Oscillospiraceae bacterium]